MFHAGSTATYVERIRAKAFAEQVQLQLNGQLKSCYSGENPLYAFVDVFKIVYAGAVKLGRLFDFFVLRLQNTSQSLLLFGNGLNQLGDGFAAGVFLGGGGVWFVQRP